MNQTDALNLMLTDGVDRESAWREGPLESWEQELLDASRAATMRRIAIMAEAKR